jgi:hypothetical protein
MKHEPILSDRQVDRIRAIGTREVIPTVPEQKPSIGLLCSICGSDGHTAFWQGRSGWQHGLIVYQEQYYCHNCATRDMANAHRTEYMAKAALEQQGWTVHPVGAPDLFCRRVVDGKVEVAIVEVKSAVERKSGSIAQTDHLSTDQHAIMDMLREVQDGKAELRASVLLYDRDKKKILQW